MSVIPVAAGLGWPGSDGVPSGGLGWPATAGATLDATDTPRTTPAGSSEETP
jgi:hypothetical protein